MEYWILYTLEIGRVNTTATAMDGMKASGDRLAARIAAGDRPALARALSLAERDPAATDGLLEALRGREGHAYVIGVTGPPGAGKSTLVGAMLREVLDRGKQVGVLAVDPSSPLTGGALLGDRLRIGEAPDAGRAFVRSTATRGSLGGLTDAARRMVRLMDVAGFDIVLVETVGTGQSEIDVARLAHTLLVAFPPGLGDELQAIKAGILELADILVVTKGDMAEAGPACRALESVLPAWRRAPPVHRVSAFSGAGVAGLVQALLDMEATLDAPGARVSRPSPLLESDVRAVWSELSRCLPFEATACAGLELETEASSMALVATVALAAGAGAFQLGAIASGMAILGAGRGFDCRIAGLDAEAGRLQLRIKRAA